MKPCPFCAEQIQDQAVVCKHCGRDLKGGASQVQLVQPKKKTGCVAAGCAIIGGLFGLGLLQTMFCSRSYYQANVGGDGVVHLPAETPKPIDPMEQIQEDVDIKTAWQKGGFGSVALWNIRLHNKSKITTWSDIRYLARYSSESGKDLSSHDGEFNIVLKPGQTRTLDNFNDSFIPQGATRARIDIIAGTYDKLPSPSPVPVRPRATHVVSRPAARPTQGEAP